MIVGKAANAVKLKIKYMFDGAPCQWRSQRFRLKAVAGLQKTLPPQPWPK
jgi:hypothetical protein